MKQGFLFTFIAFLFCSLDYQRDCCFALKFEGNRISILVHFCGRMEDILETCAQWNIVWRCIWKSLHRGYINHCNISASIVHWWDVCEILRSHVVLFGFGLCPHAQRTQQIIILKTIGRDTNFAYSTIDDDIIFIWADLGDDHQSNGSMEISTCCCCCDCDVIQLIHGDQRNLNSHKHFCLVCLFKLNSFV